MSLSKAATFRYRDQISGNAFQPGFYRPPAEQSSPAPLFQLLKGRTSSRQTSSSEVITEETVQDVLIGANLLLLYGQNDCFQNNNNNYFYF